MAEAGINVDMIVQNTSTDGTTDISFTVPKTALSEAEEIARRVAETVNAVGVEVDAKVAKVSLVGAGMKSHPGVAASVFRTLADASINIGMISTSTIRISCVVQEDDIERAVQELHQFFKAPKISQEVGA